MNPGDAMVAGVSLKRGIPTVLLAPLLLLPLRCGSDLAQLRDVLFQAQRPGETEDTYALHLADRTTHRLIKGDSASSRGMPVWSPDGRSIAFIREFDDHDQLYVIDTLGAAPRGLATELHGFFAFPDWSPDGRRILFGAGATQRHLGVYLVRADGSGLRAVLKDSAADYRCPSWAPDGRGFVVSAYRDGDTLSSILEVEVASGGAHTLLASDTSYLDCPQWSPKGDAIVLTIDPTTDPRKGDIWERWKENPLAPWRSDLSILDLKSGRLRRLVGGPGLNNYGHWSRDGGWIVFQSDRHAAPGVDSLGLGDRFRSLEIYVIRPDGSGLRRLTTNGYFDGHPSW